MFAKKDLSSPVVNMRLLDVMKQQHGVQYAMLANLQQQWRPKERNELFSIVRRAIKDSRDKLEREELARLERVAAKEEEKAAKKLLERQEQGLEEAPAPLTREEKFAAKQKQEQLNAEANRQRINASREIRGPSRTSVSLIMGLPNVGKSTLINQIVGRRRAGVASQPGWTRGQQLYKVDGFSINEKRNLGPASLLTPALRKLTEQSSWLLDTPGVMLPHRIETEQVCWLCATSNSLALNVFLPPAHRASNWRFAVWLPIELFLILT